MSRLAVSYMDSICRQYAQKKLTNLWANILEQNMPSLNLPPESLHAYTEDGTHYNEFSNLIDHAVQQYSQSPRGLSEEVGDQERPLNY